VLLDSLPVAVLRPPVAEMVVKIVGCVVPETQVKIEPAVVGGAVASGPVKRKPVGQRDDAKYEVLPAGHESAADVV
jgi:hypothetical protein